MSATAAGRLPATLRTERLELRRWRVGDVGPLLAAVRGAGADLVGAAALHRRAPGRAEVGYWVRSDRHRHGYATEAVGALTSAAFRQLPGVGAVEVRMDRANVASAGVPAKLGFALAGEEDRPVLTPCQSGRGLVWQMTRRAWEERRRPWTPRPR